MGEGELGQVRRHLCGWRVTMDTGHWLHTGIDQISNIRRIMGAKFFSLLAKGATIERKKTGVGWKYK